MNAFPTHALSPVRQLLRPVSEFPRLNIIGGAVAGCVAAGTFWILSQVGDLDRVTMSLVLGLCAALCGTVVWNCTVQVAVVWGISAIGMAMQFRLGVSVGQGMFLVSVATLGFIISAAVSRTLASRSVPSKPMVGAGLVALGTAFVLRCLPIFEGHLSSGMVTVGGTSLQIGEFTRIMAIVGFGLIAWTTLGSLGVQRLDQADRWAVGVGLILTAANVGLLVVVDTGPAIVLTAALAAMMAVSIGRIRHLLRRAELWLGAALLIYLGWMVTIHFDVLARLEQRWNNVSTPDLQLHTALRAAQSGGLVGHGIGSSAMADFIPVAKSDFVPAVVAADLGFVALGLLTVALLFAFGTLLVRVLVMRTPEAIIAAGLLVALCTQTLVTVLGAMGAIPLTGLSTPGLAATGSALISTFIALAVAAAAVPTPTGQSRHHGRYGPVRPPRLIVGLSCGIVVYLGALALMPVDPTLEGLYLKRGGILTVDGVIVATTGEDGARLYPQGALYSDLGYMSPGYGAYGVESMAQRQLTCGGQPGLAATLFQVFQRAACIPEQLTLTIRADVQNAIAAAVGDLDAQVVVSDSTTGAIVGLYSQGQPDPASYEVGQYPAAPSRRQASAPGSTFKLIVAAAALINNASPSGAPLQVLDVGGTELRNDEGFICPDTSITTMLAVSCNTTAGYLALKVGQSELERVAGEYFGAYDLVSFDGGELAPLTTGQRSAPLTAAQLARTGIGQESVQASPLAMNAATAVIARSAAQDSPDAENGIPALHVVVGDSPQRFGKLLPPAVASTIMVGMHEAVSKGTVSVLGQTASVLGRDVAAKTGTAEVEVSVSTTGVDSWVTAIVDTRWVLTARVHNANPEQPNDAVGIAAAILHAIPSS